MKRICLALACVGSMTAYKAMSSEIVTEETQEQKIQKYLSTVILDSKHETREHAKTLNQILSGQEDSALKIDLLLRQRTHDSLEGTPEEELLIKLKSSDFEKGLETYQGHLIKALEYSKHYATSKDDGTPDFLSGLLAELEWSKVRQAKKALLKQLKDALGEEKAQANDEKFVQVLAKDFEERSKSVEERLKSRVELPEPPVEEEKKDDTRPEEGSSSSEPKKETSKEGDSAVSSESEEETPEEVLEEEKPEGPKAGENPSADPLAEPVAEPSDEEPTSTTGATSADPAPVGSTDGGRSDPIDSAAEPVENLDDMPPLEDVPTEDGEKKEEKAEGDGTSVESGATIEGTGEKPEASASTDPVEPGEPEKTDKKADTDGVVGEPDSSLTESTVSPSTTSSVTAPTGSEEQAVKEEEPSSKGLKATDPKLDTTNNVKKRKGKNKRGNPRGRGGKKGKGTGRRF